jgi:ankyrin repeat protein
MIAAQSGSTEVVKLLMDHDSGTEQAKMVNKDGSNALMLAAHSGFTEVVKSLMDHDSGTEQAKMVNKDGWNALISAAQIRFTEVVKLLIEHASGKAQAEAVNSRGETALIIANRLGHHDIARLLGGVSPVKDDAVPTAGKNQTSSARAVTPQPVSMAWNAVGALWSTASSGVGILRDFVWRKPADNGQKKN